MPAKSKKNATPRVIEQASGYRIEANLHEQHTDIHVIDQNPGDLESRRTEPTLDFFELVG